MDKKTKAPYVTVIAMALVFGLASFAAVAKNDNAKNDNGKNNKSEKTVGVQDKNKSNLTVEFKNFEKPNKAKGETNAQIHKENSQEVVKNLEQVATQEKSSGNTQVSNQIQQVVQEQEQTQEQTTDAISEVESRGKFKTFLLGTDYKNLGQLRSDLVHNRNQIRKLTQTMAQVQNEGDKTLLQEQLTLLMQERERIKNIITTNESSFSLFGWVSRFLANYEQTPINEEEEQDLAEEVDEAIDPGDETTDTATTDTTTTDTTTNTDTTTTDTTGDQGTTSTETGTSSTTDTTTTTNTTTNTTTGTVSTP